MLSALAAAVPERADELAAVSARLFDLLPVLRDTYYHPEFHGSFSIKNVLPVLVPGMDYDDLEVTDGRTASANYMQALGNTDDRARRQTFDNLRAYCERDTLAMVRLRTALFNLSDRSGDEWGRGSVRYCSFCGKGHYEVSLLIAGESVYICDECVELCNNIIRESQSTR